MAALTFGVLTDIHYAQTTHGNRCCSRSIDHLAAAVKVFRDRAVPLVVNLGDSIDWVGNPYAELLFLDFVAKALAESRAELRWVIGNHDVQTLSKQEFLARADPSLTRGYYSFEHGPFHFVVLDCNFHEDGTDFDSGDFKWNHVWVSDAELEWLVDDLKAAGARPVIVLSHECLDEASWQNQLDPYIVENRQAVRSIFEDCGHILAVLSGHCHQGRQMSVGGIPYVAFHSLVAGMDDRPAYALVTVSEDGCIDVEGFGRQDSFCLVPEA